MENSLFNFEIKFSKSTTLIGKLFKDSSFVKRIALILIEFSSLVAISSYIKSALESELTFKV